MKEMKFSDAGDNFWRRFYKPGPTDKNRCGRPWATYESIEYVHQVFEKDIKTVSNSSNRHNIPKVQNKLIKSKMTDLLDM